MKFKHFTPWDSEQLVLNQVYSTNWITSRYWDNKLVNDTQIQEETNTVFDTLQTIANLIKSEIDLSPYSREIQKAKYYSELLKEYIFENIRLTEFPDKPSRTNCMFLAPHEINIHDYATNMGFNHTFLSKLEIEVTEDPNIHFADLTFLNCNADSHEEKINAARNYWSGTENRDLNTEVLFRGGFKIINITKPQNTHP